MRPQAYRPRRHPRLRLAADLVLGTLVLVGFVAGMLYLLTR